MILIISIEIQAQKNTLHEKIQRKVSKQYILKLNAFINKDYNIIYASYLTIMLPDIMKNVFEDINFHTFMIMLYITLIML